MAFYFGKFLQLIGFGLVSIAIFTFLLEDEAITKELALLASGSAVFLIGRMTESRGAGGS